MADDETAACAWCGSTEAEHLIQCTPLAKGKGPAYQGAVLCGGCADAAARFLFNAAWRKRIDGAVALAFAHGYKLEEEVSPC